MTSIKFCLIGKIQQLPVSIVVQVMLEIGIANIQFYYYDFGVKTYNVILLHSAGHPPLSAKSSSSNLNESASHGSRVKAKKSRGVGISAEPQTLQNLQVRCFRLWYFII